MAQNLHGPGLEAYLIIHITLVILSKKKKKIQLKAIFNDTEYEDDT